MGSSKTLSVYVDGHYGYSLKMDTYRSDFNRGEPPHWHLYKGHDRLAQIDIYCNWKIDSGIKLDNSLCKSVDKITREYARTIEEYSAYNREYGSD